MPLPRGTVGSPVFRAAVALTFAIVFLVAVGGELLGIDRRNGGLRWLERLPSGLGSAFGAKLAFFALGVVALAALGFASSWLVALFRHAENSEAWRERDTWLLVVPALVLGVWTFAMASWTLRGGLALLAALLVLGGIGFPIWRVIDAGYSPRTSELQTLVAVLVSGAILGAWLAFVRGSRHGRGLAVSALVCIAPAGVAGTAATGWSLMRLAERKVFDPLATNFEISGPEVTADGHFAFAWGQNVPPRWNRNALPHHALRIDLERGTCERLGSLEHSFHYFREDEHGLLENDVLVIVGADQAPRCFRMSDGESVAFDAQRKEGRAWHPKGLGQYRFDLSTRRVVIRDPFRQRDYTLGELGDAATKGSLRVRPGRWLYSPSAAGWYWFEPDTREKTPVDWPAQSNPLVLLPDGRILLANADEGLQWIHPETGEKVLVDTRGADASQITENWNGLHVPNSDDPGEIWAGSIVLETAKDGWLVLEDGATSVRRLAVPKSARFLRRVGPDRAIVQDWNGQGLYNLDLMSGVRTALWPREQVD